MKRARIPFALAIATVMILSTYFGAVAAAPVPSAIGPALVLYNRDSSGMIAPSTTNVFEAGEEIWVGVPVGSSSPYALTANSISARPAWRLENDSQPVNGLISLSLSPSSFTADNSYVISLGVRRQYSPGFMSPQTSSATISVTPSIGTLSLSSYSSQSNTVQTRLVLQDQNANPLIGVRLGLFLIQGNSSLQITSDKTDLLGSLSLYAGESLAAGTYSFEVKVLDNTSVLAQPLLIPKLTINPTSTTISAWTPAIGTISSVLFRSGNLSPIPGRLVVLERRLKDGNWTIMSEKYTDNVGSASFSGNTTSTLRVSFNGDSFYAASKSLVSNSTVLIAPASTTISGGTTSAQSSSLASQTGPVDSTFNSNTFSNGHISLKIDASGASIYDPQGQTLLARLNWQVQFSADTISWQNLPWDGPFSMSMSDSAKLHQVLLQGTAGNDQVAVSMFFQAKPTDALFTPIQMPVDLEALRGSFSYRIVWHLDGISASYVQFEQRTGDQRSVVHGPVSASSVLTQSPSGENSMVALGADMKTVLFGLNWDNGLRYYQGTSLTNGSSGASANIQFGSVTVSAGKHWIIPSCPCPDGGGGGGGETFLTTTITQHLPSTIYATLNTVISAQVKDQHGNPVPSGAVIFFVDGTWIGGVNVNSTGYASVVWTPGMTGVHSINATLNPACGPTYCYFASYKVQSVTISQTPTTLELLNPQQIAYSWDLYNYYTGNGLPIVVPVNILTLAPTNNTAPANIYMPPYSSPSSFPAHISGYGWAGLNLTSTVNVTVNGTSPETLNMNWTRNFYLPCTNPPNCSTTPRNGHLYLSATLTPPSTLYASSTTASNIPYQNVNSLSSASGQISQTATPPQHLYISVNSTYPYVSVMMQNVPVALAAYNAYLAYSLGAPLSSYVSNGYTYFQLPAGSDFAYVCTDSTCNSSASNIAVNLYDLDSHGNLVNCGTYWTTDYRGIVNIDGNGTSCGYPYAYAGIYTNGGSTVLSELFQTEARSNPSPFYTNFQGYNYATFAPQRTGRYLLHMYTIFVNSAYTVLYPSISYPDVQYPNLACCDLFLTVQKHPLQIETAFNPTTATILDKINSTIQLNDIATSKPTPNYPVNYLLTRNAPNPATVSTGSVTTNINGTVTLSIGQLAYGNYTLSLSGLATSTLNGFSTNFNFMVYKALPTLVLRDVSGVTSAVTGTIKYVNPGGTSSIPAIVHSQSSPYEFYVIIGSSTDLLNTPPGITASCSTSTGYWLVGAGDRNCVGFRIRYQSCATTGCSNYGDVVKLQWANGQPSGSTACAQSTFTNCSQTVSVLTGTSNICGSVYCYRFSAFVGSINAIPSWWLEVFAGVCDSSSNCAEPPVTWGYVDSPDGSFLVDGTGVRHSDASTPLGEAVGFQFNATSSPNSITSVTMNVFNQTASSNKMICLIGGSGCLQSAQTTIASFLVYSPNTITLTPGNYVITVTMTCPACAQVTIQVLSLVIVMTQTAWSENGTVNSLYWYEISLVNNSTSTQIATSGLTESIYINGISYATLQTDSNGNVAFAWNATAAGQYTIKVVLPQQNYYTNTTLTIIVSISRRNVLLAVSSSPPSPNVNQQVTWDVYATDMVTNTAAPSVPINMYINGVNQIPVSTNSTGWAVFSPSPALFSLKGSYNVTFVSSTTSIYNSASSYDPLIVYLQTSLAMQGATIMIGQSVTIPIALKDANGSPIANRVVAIKVNGASYANLTTDSNGSASFTLQPNSVANYTIVASYSPTGPGDIGYSPSSASAIVVVTPKQIVNTQTTGSSTQSVTFTTAQGSTPIQNLPSISISFPSIGAVSVSFSLNGITVSASASVSIGFGLNCVARAFGTCVLWAPSIKITLGAAVSPVLNLQLSMQVLSGGTASSSLSAPPTITVSPLSAGLLSSTAIGAIGDAALVIPGAGLMYAGLAIQAAEFAATAGAWLGYGGMNVDKIAFENYLYGLLAPPVGAIPCALLQCPVVPPSIPYVTQFFAALAAWSVYMFAGVIAPLFVSVWSPLLFVVTGLLLPAAALAYYMGH